MLRAWREATEQGELMLNRERESGRESEREREEGEEGEAADSDVHPP